MGNIVVAKKYRLGKDGDKFSEKFKTPIRNRVVIDEDEVKRFNKTTAISGQMYEIDEQMTKARDAEVEKQEAKRKGSKNKKGDPVKNEDVDSLRKELEELKASLANANKGQDTEAGAEDDSKPEEPKKPGRPPKNDK